MADGQAFRGDLADHQRDDRDGQSYEDQRKERGVVMNETGAVLRDPGCERTDGADGSHDGGQGRDERQPGLNGGLHRGRLFEQLFDQDRRPIALFDQLSNAGLAHRDKGVFGQRQEGVDADQCEHQSHLPGEPLRIETMRVQSIELPRSAVGRFAPADEYGSSGRRSASVAEAWADGCEARA